MSNCIPCSPCNNNCPDDGEIIETTILDADDCWGCWSCWWCKDNCGINIQSTNDCLTVDTSECWVIKLTAECPKPTYVKAGDNVTVRDITPPSDCYIDWGECWTEGWWEVSSTDEKVKACSWDTTPWYLNQKIEAWDGIEIDEVNCWWWNAYLRIGIKDWTIPEIPEIPEVKVNYDWDLLRITQAGDHNHIINISDNTKWSFYDNVVMLGFHHNKDYDDVGIDAGWNSVEAQFIETSNPKWWGRDLATWNTDLATKDGIVVKQAWHYFIYWQITVCLNRKDLNRYWNLWRWIIRLYSPARYWSTPFYMNTAKHWAYWTQITFKWGQWISIAQDGTISTTWASVTTSSGWGSRNVNFNAWWWAQPQAWFDWPWATLNIWVYLDLYEWDKITLWYRPQSNITTGGSWDFRLVWSDDSSTTYKAIFGWTVLWLHPITPTLFQADESQKTRHDME